MVVRGYLSGHAWRQYKIGFRTLCGEKLPDGLLENGKLPTPIITPTTKAKKGHDEDISKQQIIAGNLISAKDYAQIEQYSLALFARGSAMALEQGLILVDTKYEFGKIGDQIYLIDEIHTPDSSRYFYAEGYEQRQANKESQKQLSKEFVREWLIANGFQGKDGQKIPQMSDVMIKTISDRYIELYEKVTGETFDRTDNRDIENRIEANILQGLEAIQILN
jgi:phosphoribosylaminoimidazole-succinocarboxamide synthase